MMATAPTYLVPAPDHPVVFGDIFSSKWLFDAMINADAVPLAEFARRGGGPAYEPLDPDTKRRTNLVLTRGQRCRAILLSDDCEAETWLVRKGGSGRLLFAAIGEWPTDSEEAERIQASNSFRRHPLPPANGFDGGVVELFRLFAVSGKALLDTSGRVYSLSQDARAGLEQRWAAHATRRGPLAALDNGTKLAHVLEAGDDEALWAALLSGDTEPGSLPLNCGRSVAEALTGAWRLEGEGLAPIADAHEARESAPVAVAALRDELRALARLADEAAAALDEALAAS
jgi:hypothetical protein